MMSKLIRVVGVFLILVFLICGAEAQSWTENLPQTTNSTTTMGTVIDTFTVSGGPFSWSESCPNWITVTGSATQSPPAWDWQYANVEDIEWTYTQSFSYAFPSPGTVYDTMDWYAIGGTESWTYSSTPPVTVTRSCDDFVTTNMSFTFTPLGEGGGSGSGS